MRGSVKKEYASALTHGSPGWRLSFSALVSGSGVGLGESVRSMIFGDPVSGFVRRDGRGFDGVVGDRADVCPTMEGEGYVV